MMSSALITRPGLVLLLVALGIAVIASDQAAAEPKPWFIDEEELGFEALDSATAYWGVHAGAGYRIEVPDDWNGDLVLYAHGYRGEVPELTVSNPSIREHLIDKGYAWAASSYRANGYVPGTGAIDTHNLMKRFNGVVGKPDRVYIMGHSMGGHVTAVAIEQWPNAFDGALPMCGVTGDNELFDYFLDIYLVAETLAGNDPLVPTPDDYAGSGSLATRNALGPSYPVALNGSGEKFKSVIENLTGGERPVFDLGFIAWGDFIFTVAGTGDGRDNAGTVYQFDHDPALTPEEQAFNEDILRIEADPQFRDGPGLGRSPGSLNVSPTISGNIGIPVLSLHTLGDLFVPFHMQQIYAEEVAAHGASDLLVSRAIRDAGHCGFTTEEQVQAFDDLVEWVEHGVKPAGDDILDPETVAEPDFGCQFTSEDRTLIAPCP